MTGLKQKKLNDGLPASVIKGLILERDAHQFLWDLGYLVFPRLTLYAIRYKKREENDKEVEDSLEKLVVTDLDCYGISFGEFLEEKSFLIDCKHKSDNVFSQIFKLKGISEFLRIKNLLILRDSVPETVEQFADKFNVRLISNSSFRKKFNRREKGSFSLRVYKKILNFHKGSDSKTHELIARFSNCFLERNPYQRIKKLRVLYNELKPNLISSNNEKEIKLNHYLILRIFLYTLVTIAQIASNTIHLSLNHFNGFIEQKLIGDIDFKKKFFGIIKEIQDSINPNGQEIKPVHDLTPSFTPSLKNLVKKFHKDPKFVQIFLRYNDFIIHEYYLFKKEINFNETKGEFGDINRDLFGEWNINCLEILDKEKKYPVFLIKLLT